MTEETQPRCLDEGSSTPCEGIVEYCSLDGIKFWPRCDTHWYIRLERHEDSIERYADSDVAPAWFDPADAGERWEDDY